MKVAGMVMWETHTKGYKKKRQVHDKPDVI